MLDTAKKLSKKVHTLEKPLAVVTLQNIDIWRQASWVPHSSGCLLQEIFQWWKHSCLAAWRSLVQILAWSLSVWSLHVPPVDLWILPWYSGFLPQSKQWGEVNWSFWIVLRCLCMVVFFPVCLCVVLWCIPPLDHDCRRLPWDPARKSRWMDIKSDIFGFNMAKSKSIWVSIFARHNVEYRIKYM